MQSKDTADVNGTSSQASPSEAWWRTRSIVTKRSSGRRCEHERWRGNELNTELGARYSTRWPRSGCPIRTAPGDSATGIREVSDLLRAVQQRRDTTEWPDTDIVICSAQRRPGHQPRRHTPPRGLLAHTRARSTKAGASTPATRELMHDAIQTAMALNEGRGINPGDTCTSSGRPRRIGPLNEGRGINPGDTLSTTQPSRQGSAPLNEGRGINPGDTAQTRITATAFYDAQRRPGHQPRRHSSALNFNISSGSYAQRRPGHQPRRHARTFSRLNRSRIPFNEGRGINPGDTGPMQPNEEAFYNAQRRPGHQPRRHLDALSIGDDHLDRSTKAGASTPATPRVLLVESEQRFPRSTKAGASTPATRRLGSYPSSGPPALNEGRGINPGDTRPQAGQNVHSPGRSTKAGASTPATRRRRMAPQHGLCPLNEGRGINPGDTTPTHGSSTWALPAQRRPGHQPRRHRVLCGERNAMRASLNEGRGINPGDTCQSCRRAIESRLHRSTKAGASTPATHSRQRISCGGHAPLNEGRGINPGDTPCAKSCGTTSVQRSTKAGASTPATRAKPTRSAWATSPLNEGRGINPGDTGGEFPLIAGPDSAQRRPGHQPRRHVNCSGSNGCNDCRSTKAGASTPATPTVRARRNTCTARRSTKAGASTPATPVPIQLRPSAHAVAQRRPGHQPRRHRARGRSWALR